MKNVINRTRIYDYEITQYTSRNHVRVAVILAGLILSILCGAGVVLVR